MLTKSSLIASFPLAQQLAMNGAQLAPVGDSPLAALVSASLVDAQTVGDAPAGTFEEQPELGELMLQSSANADMAGVCQHDAIMANTVAAVSKAVEKNLDLARNVVGPLIKKVVEDTQAYMDSTAQSSLAPMSISPFYYQSLWDNPTTVDFVRKFENAPVTPVALSGLTLPAPTSALEAMLTGAGSYDADIKAFVDAVGEEYLQGVWRSVFGGGVSQLSDYLRWSQDKIDATLATFLFARRLFDDVPEGLNMDLSAYKAYMGAVVGFAGRLCCAIYKKREADVGIKALVNAMPVGGQGSIQVNGDVYQSFLEAGGSPEVLFGAAVSDGQRNFATLLEAKDRYVREWQRTYALLQSKAASVRLDSMISGLRGALVCLLKDESLGFELSADIYQQRIKERLAKIKPKDIEDIWHVARKAVCRVFYPQTDVERVLNAVDASALAHPELDIREAGLLATIDFVAAWVADLMTVTLLSDMGRPPERTAKFFGA
jgi:hypothetical protein